MDPTSATSTPGRSLLPALVALALLLPALAAAADVALPAAPTDFSRYAVKVDAIKVQEPKLSGKAASFKTKLREALQEAATTGPNFAGHFVVAEWGCGSSCIQGAVIDTDTGQVHFPPQLQGSTTGRGELDSEAGTQYKADSRLLLVRGFPADSDRYGVWAYEWTGTALRPQGFTARRGVP